jgi:putative membrane protein
MGKALWIVAPALVLALAGCDKQPAAETPSGDNVTLEAADASLPADADMPVDVTQQNDARSYLDQAATGDSFEIRSSEAILKITVREDIRSFARMMITAHAKSAKELDDAAGKLKLAAGAPTLSAAQLQKIGELDAATGAEADNLYLGMQRDGHNEALVLHRRYAADGDMPSLKTVASSIAPVVQQHLDALAKLPKMAPK